MRPASAARIVCAKKQESRCLLHPDWMNSLASSNQRGVTAWLRMSFQNVTKSRSNGKLTENDFQGAIKNI